MSNDYRWLPALLSCAFFVSCSDSKNSEAEIERRAQDLAENLVEEKLRPAGEVKTFGGIEMVWCPPGEFLMGSPEAEEQRSDNEPQHRVTLTRGFWLAKTECTQGQWELVMGNNPSEFKGVDLPVENVSWDDVQGWLAKMNERNTLPAGWRWDLPTEAQWEYACRAGTETEFHFGATLNGREANCDGNSSYGTSEKGPYLERTAKVGSYVANSWGLYDMHGNVEEWCRDNYGVWYGDKDYPPGSATDPNGPDMDPGSSPRSSSWGSGRVIRGGSWLLGAASCRSANRKGDSPGGLHPTRGFRVAVSSTP